LRQGVDLVARLLRFKLGKTPSDVDRVLTYVLRSAYRNSSGYRQFLDESGVSLDGFRGVEDLPRLPIVDRERFFGRFSVKETLHSGADPDRCVRTGTSGSTGVPMIVFMSREEAFYRRILLFNAWRRMMHIALPLTVIDLGSPVAEGETTVVRRSPLVRVVRISIALRVERQIELLLRHRAQILTGYPTALSLFAEAVPRASDLPSTLKLIATRGEVLHEETRRRIEEAFAVRVADFYSCEEVGNMAWECPEDPSILHVNTDGCVLEIVDSKGDPVRPGVEGRVLVSNLYNCTMPLIRYDLHDRGVLHSVSGGRCACGSRQPSMAILSGRDDDYVYLPDRRRVSPRLLATAVNRALSDLSPRGALDRHFRRFQVIQDALDHVTVRVIPEADRPVDFQMVIRSAVRNLHPELRCAVEEVEEIPLEPSGKFKKVICNI
jgi:phenylacetate-CoA ligase